MNQRCELVWPCTALDAFNLNHKSSIQQINEVQVEMNYMDLVALTVLSRNQRLTKGMSPNGIQICGYSDYQLPCYP